MEGDNDLIYPELSYKIIGIAFKIFNSMGYGYQEKYIQRAFAKELTTENLKFTQEKEVKISYKGEHIGKYFLDFIVDDKIVVELKVAPFIKHIHIRQVLEYLNETNLKLAILIYFTRDGVKYKRVINPNI